MPETYHGLCTWHLCQNDLKNVGNFLQGETSFLTNFKACIYEYEDADELYAAWETILARYGIEDSWWMHATFKVKEKWAKAYMKRTFSAGMRSTQIVESLNASLRHYLKANLDILRFFNHFERVVNDKHYKELEVEYDARQKLPRLKMRRSHMLNQADTLYTQKIFEEFQNEYDIYQAAIMKSCVQNGDTYEYVIALLDEIEEYKVSASFLERKVTCSCAKFETFGILCSHTLKVLDVINHKLIPDPYILKRWTRNARDDIVQDAGGKQILSDTKLEVTDRYKTLCLNLVKLASRAAELEQTFKLVAKFTSELSKKFEDILKKKFGRDQDNFNFSNIPSFATKTKDSMEEQLVAIKEKGFKKKERTYKGSNHLKSWVEK